MASFQNALAKKISTLKKFLSGELHRRRIKQYAEAIASASKNANFFYDVRSKSFEYFPDNLCTALSKIDNHILYVYPAIEDSKTLAIVFVTHTTLWKTIGYLVCLGDALPEGHRAGLFHTLRPIGDDVYLFTSR
jgi:hypothetical protein